VNDNFDDPYGDDSEKELRDLLNELLSGGGTISPEHLAKAAGLPHDPATLSALITQLQDAIQNADGGIDWSVAMRQAEERATSAQEQVSAEQRTRFDRAFGVASLWLDEAVDFSASQTQPELLTRRAWVAASMPTWIQLSEPVAISISDSLTRVISENAPEEMRDIVAGAGKVIRGAGGALFAMQLGQVVGQLSAEVVSGGDIGIPLLADGHGAILPQNASEFGAGLDLPHDEIDLYLAVRELAYARLFRHARWLRLHLITSITAFARGISVNTDELERLADRFDPSDTEELRQAVASGSLIRSQSDGQNTALISLETLLALVEGWVDAVTADATSRLPRSDAIAESIRRRRATGGPAESAFASLVGLELRPRRLRDAAALWRAVTNAVGIVERDGLWGHPDLLPGPDDLDDPSALITRLTHADGAEVAADQEFDRALDELLRGATPAAPGEHGTERSGTDTRDGAGPDAESAGAGDRNSGDADAEGQNDAGSGGAGAENQNLGDAGAKDQDDAQSRDRNKDSPGANPDN